MNKLIIAGIVSLIAANTCGAAFAQYYDPYQQQYQAAERAAAEQAWARSGAGNADPTSPNYGRVPGTDIFDPSYVQRLQQQKLYGQAYPYYGQSYNPYMPMSSSYYAIIKRHHHHHH